MKFKRTLSIILTLMTMLSTVAIFGSFSASAENGYDRGYKQTMAGTGKVVAEGLDISEHQNGINLQKIKDAGFDYVIIRAGVKLNAGSNRKDYNFEDFYAQARKVGLDVGTYYYSQAKSTSEAVEEAKCFLEYIKGKTFEYPVYLDFESSSVKDALGSSSSKATEICYAFMDTMRDAGYLVGLYGYASWFDDGYSGWMSSKLNNDIGKKYEFWMANYFNNMQPENTRTQNYKNKYGMYQYTSSKTISGWSGSLDHNVCYKDYPAIVKQYGFNGYESGGAVTPETEETIAVNKYAISSEIKKVKEHIGSEITMYSLDGKKVEKSASFALDAGQKLSIKGYAGFTVEIKEFGYYFDGDDASAVWSKGFSSTASAATKKKAGDNAKNFDIAADTSGLSAGEHTLTYVVKLANKEVDLITVALNVNGAVEGSGELGSGGVNESESGGIEEDGCGSAIGAGAVAVALTAIGGAAIIKKKRED